MAPSVEERWQYTQSLERELHNKLNEKDPLYEEIEHLIYQIRIACETTIFLNFDYAAVMHVESHLWDSHTLINNRYRKITTKYKSEEYKSHVIERRKWEKRYADFLKTSQFFYKGYIQRLASHFTGLSELRKIAHRLQLGTLSADDRVEVSGETQHRILLSCHATLLRLGDLSRYRNNFRIKDKSWDRAMAYYGLANDLFPQSGHAFNQMAVISLAEGQHLDAIYHLYRALAIEEPHPVAGGNLATEFKSIIRNWESGGKNLGKNIVPSDPSSKAIAGNTAPLISWFVRLHAKLYKGEEFHGHDELENEVLSQMTVLLKEQSLEGVLDKIVLINIAAEYFAAERLQASSKKGMPSQEQFRSYYSLLRLNIRMLFMLLQLLEPELAGSRDEDAPDVTGRLKKGNTESITAVTRRILPALRQYSTWLVSRAEIITAQKSNFLLNVHIKEMWTMYCSTLSLLVVTFPPENLSEVDYLLEEDAATVGMKPLRDSDLCKLYTDDEGQLKSRISDPGVQRSHPNLEMLARVRDLLRDGVVLASNKIKDGNKLAPIQLMGVKFHFIEDGLPMSPVDPQPSQNASFEYLQNANISKISDSAHIQTSSVQRAPSVAQSDSQSMSTDMYQMVDDLVTPIAGQKTRDPQLSNETSYGMHSLTAADVFAPTEAIARPISRHQASPTPFPILPGIYNSPFSPQPGELPTVTPERPGTAGRLSSLRLPSNEQLNATEATPEMINEYCNSQRPAWEDPDPSSISLTSPARKQDISQTLQNSHPQQFNSTSSTSFSHPSSLYWGTPSRDHSSRRPYRDISFNTSTTYSGASGFELTAMLQSSIWNGSQQGWTGHGQTPPNGQG